MRRLALVLVVLSLALGSPDADAKRKQLSVEEQYELGLRYMKRGYYVKALEQFNRVRNYHRDDPYAVKAELAIADVYYKKHEWDQARLAYEDFMRMHPRHADLDYVVYRVGMSHYKKAPKPSGRDQTPTRQAVNAWSGFESRFPSSEYAGEVGDLLHECRERLARREYLIATFYERREAWKAVEGRADGLLRSYPDSAYAPRGLALLAEALAWRGSFGSAREVVEKLGEKDPGAAARVAEKVDRIEAELAGREAP